MTPVEPSPSRKSILLIEDDTELTLLMTDYFGQHGFDVIHYGVSARYHSCMEITARKRA